MQPLEGAHAFLFNKKITPVLQYDLIQIHQETGTRRNFSSLQGQLQQGKRTYNVYKFPICFFACKSFLLVFLFLENMEVVVRCPQGFHLFQKTKGGGNICLLSPGMCSWSYYPQGLSYKKNSVSSVVCLQPMRPTGVTG